jgi:hypothetical protein
MTLILSNAIAFASTFYFLAETRCGTKKLRRACKPTHEETVNLRRHCYGLTEARTDNKGFKEIEGSVVNQKFVHLIKCSGRLTVQGSETPTS